MKPEVIIDENSGQIQFPGTTDNVVSTHLLKIGEVASQLMTVVFLIEQERGNACHH